MNDREVEVHQIPDHLMLPLLEHGSLIDDESLQAVWAQLIASASSGLENHAVWPSFPQLLSELTPLEAQILGHLYEVILTKYHGHHGFVPLHIRSFVEHHGGSPGDAQIIEDNFIRLQILKPSKPVMRAEEVGKTMAEYIQSRGSALPRDLELEDNRRGGLTMTALGWAFLKACAGPTKNLSADDSAV